VEAKLCPEKFLLVLVISKVPEKIERPYPNEKMMQLARHSFRESN